MKLNWKMENLLQYASENEEENELCFPDLPDFDFKVSPIRSTPPVPLQDVHPQDFSLLQDDEQPGCSKYFKEGDILYPDLEISSLFSALNKKEEVKAEVKEVEEEEVEEEEIDSQQKEEQDQERQEQVQEQEVQ